MTQCAPGAERFYRRVLDELGARQVRYLVGGAFALEHYTGIARPTKDLDLFVRPADCDRVLEVMAAAGYETELTSTVWIAKIREASEFVDVIFNSGNGIAEVDDAWFEHAEPATLLGTTVDLCPPEETIWSKGYVMERERYDGADVVHLIRACGRRLDWKRLLARFDTHWPVLLSHVVIFSFVYPSDRAAVPPWVVDELCARWLPEMRTAPLPIQVCRGTLLSKEQYRNAVEEWGYRDGRLVPHGRMTPDDVDAL
jgi:hypothetical protein